MPPRTKITVAENYPGEAWLIYSDYIHILGSMDLSNRRRLGFRGIILTVQRLDWADYAGSTKYSSVNIVGAQHHVILHVT